MFEVSSVALHSCASAQLLLELAAAAWLVVTKLLVRYECWTSSGHQVGLNGLLGAHSAAGNPLLGDILVVLAQLFAATQFVGESRLCFPSCPCCPSKFTVWGPEVILGLCTVHVCQGIL